MTTNRTSRRAEDFDRALTVPNGRVDPAMAALVAIAGALAATPQRATPVFKDALRTKLMAEAASLAAAGTAAAPAASVPAATAPLRALPKLLAQPAMQVATGGLAAAIAVTGLGVGSSRSLPGDALYGLKRNVEGLQVGLAGGPTAEAMALLEHAQTRLDEVHALLARGDLDRVAGALEALDTELHRATSRLLAEARDGSRLAYDTLTDGLAGIRADLLATLPDLPGEALPAAFSALQTLNVTAVQARLIVPPPEVVHTGPGTPRISDGTEPPATTPPPSSPGTPPPSSSPIVVPPPPTTTIKPPTPSCITLPVAATCVPVTPSTTSVPVPTPTVPLPSASLGL
jgi:hypothetical protein